MPHDMQYFNCRVNNSVEATGSLTEGGTGNDHYRCSGLLRYDYPV